MNKIIATSVFVLIFNLTVSAQTNHFNNTDSIEIELNQKADGFGPRGITFSGINPKNTMDILEQAACPEMKNIPTTLSNVVEYYYHSNRFQFFYQNYRSGVFSKDYFLKVAANQRWNLKDTIQLTEKNLKTTISIVTGTNSDGINMYIVDYQNNGDFGDDVLKPLLPLGYKQEEVVRNSCSVAMDYFDGEAVKSDIQLMVIGQSHNSKSDAPAYGISFPQFRYSKFNYKNKSYFVCKEFNDYNHSIYILNDRPYFSTPGDKEVKPFQFVELDGDYFQYIPKSQNTERILLKKVPRPEGKALPIASQVAMTAPEISGLDILNNSNISLNSLKGKYVFIDFWSTNCAPCIAEFPNIKEVYEKFDRNQLEIIGVVDDRTPDKKIKEFIEKKNLVWPTINMNMKSTTIKGYDVKSYPTTYLINPNGVIIATNLRGDELMNQLQSLKIEK